MEVGCPSEPSGVDGVVRAILDKVPQGLVDSDLQLLVFKAHGYAVVLDGEAKIVHLEHTNDCERRRVLRIVSGDWIVVHYSVDLAILKVQGSKLDVGVGFDLHTGDQLGINLACRANLNADRLSHKILGFGDSILGRVVHNAHVRPIVGNGEADLLLAVCGDRHGRNDNLKLLRLEGRDDAVPSGGHDVRFQPKLLGDGGNEVDVKTCRLVGTVDKLERSERCIVADSQNAVLFDTGEVGGSGCGSTAREDEKR